MRWRVVLALMFSACYRHAPTENAPPNDVQSEAAATSPRRTTLDESPKKPAVTESDVGDAPMLGKGEVIVVRGRRAVVVTPKKVKARRSIPPYSSEAASTNRWARAWLLLDVDQKGVVTRAKFLNAPGYDLDEIALAEVFALRFSAALDKEGKPTASYVLHHIEWPSYWWVVAHRGTVSTKYPAMSYVPCRDSGAPLNLDMVMPVYRDCTKPDLSKIKTAPWIDAPREVASTENR